MDAQTDTSSSGPSSSGPPLSASLAAPERRAAWAAPIVARPLVVLVAALACVIAFGAGLTRVVKDPSVDAFVSVDHPAAVARDRARAIFDIEDPIVVALVAEDAAGMWTPERLTGARALSAALADVDGVRADALMSPLTESALRGEGGDLFVDPIIPDGALSPDDASQAWARMQTMAPFMGVLASDAGDAIMLIVPVDDPDHAVETYADVARIAAAADISGVTAHVAGVAAMNGRLGYMVDTDTRKFVPLAVLIVMLVVFVAVRRPKALVGPLLVIAGSAAVAIGLMGWMGARYYLITTALPVVIMAIAVADSLHLSLSYLRARTQDASLDARAATRLALARTAMPISLTSVTTIAGFTGLAIGSHMTPIKEFGWYAAVGVAAAWLLSLTLAPALLVLLNVQPARPRGAPDAASDAASDLAPSPESGALNAALGRISVASASRPSAALVGFALISAALVAAGSFVEFDYERKRYFSPDDPVRIADAAINAKFAGVNMLDVVVTGPEPGALLSPLAVAAVADLQDGLAQAPHVTKTTSYVDYLALMHARLTDAPDGALPTRDNAGAQYMFLYEASGDPDDFKEEIDYEYQTALIRAHLDRDDFIDTSATVDAFAQIAQDWSNVTGLDAQVSGRIAVNHGWMSALSTSHVRGLGLALAFVFVCSVVVFRAVAPALIVMLPVLSGVGLVYAVMGVFDIDLAPATSMCAAISTGLGVDFGIHLVAAIRARLAEGASVREAVSGRYVTVARACVYSAAALAIGLSCVTLSSAPALQWFGLLIASGAVGALLAALLVAPAAAAVLLTPSPRPQGAPS